MRALLFAVLCLSMVIYGMAKNDLILGERQPGDHIDTNRTIWKPPIPMIPMRAIIGVTAKSQGEVLTQVNCINSEDNEATFTLLKGNVGEKNVVIFAVGKPGKGLNVTVQAYAIDPATITTAAPPSTTPDDGEGSTSGGDSNEGSDGNNGEDGNDGGNENGSDNGNETGEDNNNSDNNDSWQ